MTASRPTVLLVGIALACASSALYLGYAVYWMVAAITDDPVVEAGSVSLHGWLGLILSAAAFAGCVAALLAAWGGRRLWPISKSLAMLVLAVGVAIGGYPAWTLLTVPANA